MTDTPKYYRVIEELPSKSQPQPEVKKESWIIDRVEQPIKVQLNPKIFKAPITTVEPSRSLEFLPRPNVIQCKICQIIYKSPAQLKAHMLLHDKIKAKLAVSEMTKNVYEKVKMDVVMTTKNKPLYVLLPDRDFGFITRFETGQTKYMKCMVNGCDVKAYQKKDGNFYLKVGEVHKHISCSKLIVELSVKKETKLFTKQFLTKAKMRKIEQQKELSAKLAKIIKREKKC